VGFQGTTYELDMRILFFASFLLFLASCSVEKEKEPVFDRIGNHHIHSFSTSEETAWHALAMGYSMICHEKPEGPEFGELGLITSHNARVSPIRIYVDKKSGEIMIRYFNRYTKHGSNKSAIAGQYGLDRIPGKAYPLIPADWGIICGYAAMKKDASGIPAAEVTESTFEEYFAPTWPLEDEHYRSFNLGANWQSRKVVHDFTSFLKTHHDWSDWDALFLDGINNIDVEDPVNRDFGGMGHYSSAREGQHDFMGQMAGYLRNPDSTGNDRPLLIVANVFSPKGKGGQEITRAYGQGKLRFDHYYYEGGGIGEQKPNGVVPGTDQPAYVVPGEPGYFIPADRLALDDKYAYNNAVHKGAVDFNREEHFLQHLDACGTAGVYGSWFGWYGEDAVALGDENGDLVYTNDLQLLRAIPNWDNLWDIPVPPFQDPPASGRRSWKDWVYSSDRSFASSSVIYSLSPFNSELYVVFREPGIPVDLKGAKIRTAWWVDDWFRKTDESAMQDLSVKDGQLMLKTVHFDGGSVRGIRIELK
jgi:hypothetical protein